MSTSPGAYPQGSPVHGGTQGGIGAKAPRREAGLEAAFRPRRVALIGASERVHYHRSIVRNLQRLGFPLENLALVNPNRESVFGRPCYPTIAHVPGDVDVAMVATGAGRVPELVEACGLHGVRAVVVLSAGFAEAGTEGLRLQTALAELAAQYGVALIGPNSLGLVDTSAQLGLFASELPELSSGNVSAIFQSGGLLNLFLGLMASRRLGLAWAIATGNEAVVTLADLLERAIRDEATRVIVLYLETVRDPAGFRTALASAEEAGKPVIVLRAGLSTKGRRNVGTHSGNLASGSAAWGALLRQRNAAVVGNIDDMLEATVVFSHAEGRRARPTRPQALLMSVSGGDCTLLADIAERTGWTLPDLPASAHTRLIEIVGKPTLADNPLDVGGLWRRGLIAPVADLVSEQVDVDVIGLRLNLPDEPANELLAAYQYLADASYRSGKLPIALSRASERLPVRWYAFFGSLGVPFLQEYERGLRAARSLVEYHAHRRRVAQRTVDEAESEAPLSPSLDWFWRMPPGPLTFLETKRLLLDFGVPVAPSDVARTRAEAGQLADRLGYPVAVKVDSRFIMHRSDVGAVRLRLATRHEVEEAFEAVVAAAERSVPQADIEGVLVQEMVEGVAELLVGVQLDQEVGPVLLLGLGGIFAEIFQDVALRPAPIAPVDVEEMLVELTCLPLLTGARGRPKADLEALSDLLLRISRLAMTLGASLASLDLNPVIVRAAGRCALVVDAVAVRSEARAMAPGH